MKKALLVVCVLALLSVAAAAYATDAQWLISFKAVNPNFQAGGAAVSVGIGTGTSTLQAWPTTVGSTAQAEQTGTETVWHARHTTPRAPVTDETYQWFLKIGARSDYVGDTFNIVIWNNKSANLGNGGELNHNLAYVFEKQVAVDQWQTLAWFSDPGTAQAAWAPVYGLATWHDVGVLLQTSSAWSPTSALQGFFVTDTVVRSAAGGFADIGSYRLTVVPEPGSLMALGSGLIGLAGLAIRRRRA